MQIASARESLAGEATIAHVGSRRFRHVVLDDFHEDLMMWQRLWYGTDQLPRFRRMMLLLARHPGLRAAMMFRLARWAHLRNVRGLTLLLSQLNFTLHSIEIAPSVEVGGGLYLPHPAGIVVFARHLGSRVTIQSNVTIGMRASHEFPTIGDDVLLAAGSRVIGEVAVGNAAQVGANAVVLCDVPPGATALGVPARVS